MLLALTLGLLASAGATGLSGPVDPDEVYGGAPVTETQHEAVVALSIGTGLCTGTLLSNDVVLTAAHCFDTNPSPTAVEVTVGPDVRNPVAVLPIDDYVIHPCEAAGCATDGRDLAIVHLAEPAPTPLEGFPRPIVDQAEYDEMSSTGSIVRVVGYGKDLSGDTGLKRYVDVKINSFRSFGAEFEAGGGGRDSCDGDSGGPALALADDLTWRIVGVLSRGYTCGSGGIYVVPFPSLCWIEEETGLDLVPPTCAGCGCVDIDPDRFDDGACAVARPDRTTHPAWLGFGLLIWLGLRPWRRSPAA